VDVGGLRRARQLEHLGLLHIAVQQPLDLGFRERDQAASVSEPRLMIVLERVT
jgi:hypothetical protein